MKKMVAVGLVGLAVGLVMPGVFAQAPQAEVQKWEQFCETQTYRRGTAATVEAANPRIASHGKNGYQLVGGVPSPRGPLVFCYRRPMQ